MGGSDKSRLMCCVYCRLSGKQHHPSCFSQRYCGNIIQVRWASSNNMMWNFLLIQSTKIIKIYSFSRSYSKYKKEVFFSDTVYITSGVDIPDWLGMTSIALSHSLLSSILPINHPVSETRSSSFHLDCDAVLLFPSINFLDFPDRLIRNLYF